MLDYENISIPKYAQSTMKVDLLIFKNVSLYTSMMLWFIGSTTRVTRLRVAKEFNYTQYPSLLSSNRTLYFLYHLYFSKPRCL